MRWTKTKVAAELLEKRDRGERKKRMEIRMLQVSTWISCIQLIQVCVQ